MSTAQWRQPFVQTARRMKTPVLVIGQVLGLGFLTRYSGTDAVLGLAFNRRRGPVSVLCRLSGLARRVPDRLGHCLECAVRRLQRITAQQLHLNEVLIVATNSTGGVMGKMIDAQSIMVACAACYDDPSSVPARWGRYSGRSGGTDRRSRADRPDRNAAGLRVPGRDPDSPGPEVSAPQPPRGAAHPSLGPRRSTAPATRRQRSAAASRPGRAITLTPIGRPCSPVPNGRPITGQPSSCHGRLNSGRRCWPAWRAALRLRWGR